MRINRVALIGGAAVTGLVIGVIAFGQTRGQKRVAAPAVAPTGDKRVTVPGNVPAGEPVEPTSLAGAAVTSVRVAAEDGIVKVEAEAAVRETEPGYVSVWSLRIYEDTSPAADRRLVKEHHYTESPWWVADGETSMQPTFADQFGMEPGSYVAVISIYTVSANWDWSKVARGEDIRRRVRTRSSFKKKITVGL